MEKWRVLLEMFSKKIKFANKNLKKILTEEYQNNALMGVINELEYSFKYLIITDYKSIGAEKHISMICPNNQEIEAVVNALNWTMTLKCPSWDCNIKYQVYPNSCLKLGKEYHKDDHVVLYNNSQDNRMHYFTYQDKDNYYEINITKFSGTIDNMKIVDTLLNSKSITRIKDVMDILVNLVELENVEINIKNNKFNLSNIIIYKGRLTKYVEYIEKENERDLIYMQEGKFYIERTKKEELGEEIVPYVKKIGDYHGKK